MKPRTLNSYIDKMLTTYKKMVFLSGPRQVGKTTLAQEYINEKGGGVYFNWDIITDQKRLVKTPYFFEEEDLTPSHIIVFDEIHKYSKWKNYLKGAYDKYKNEYRFIITGSGRLDLFKKGEDSLMGRYISLPLFPFTLSESLGHFIDFDTFKTLLIEGPSFQAVPKAEYQSLFEFGGFPEPLIRQAKDFYNIWHQERKTALIRTDIRDATNIREISLLEMLSHLIVERIGNPLSINALREDIGVAFETVRDWLQILSYFYYIFQISPFTGSLKRTLRKETKTYLFDWAEIEEPSVRFENLVAFHLLKAVNTWKSVGQGDLNLYYIRDKEKREVDFVIVEKTRPVCLIETKLNDSTLSKHLLYYQDKLNIPVGLQILHKTGVNKKMRHNGKLQWVVSADQWLTCLP